MRVIKKKLKAASAQQDVVRPQANLLDFFFNSSFLHLFIYLFKLGRFRTRLRPTVSPAKPRNSTFKLLCMNLLGDVDPVHTMCLVESQLTDI